MQYGEQKHGIKIGLSKPKPVYRLNHRVNIWIAYSVAGPVEEGYQLGKDQLLITNPDGSVTDLPGDTRIDVLGPPVLTSWYGGMSDRLHDFIRKPGTYKMQWHLGDLESAAISFEVVR